ncbi:FKBP-type peptidyl-prolyl cis-trans isomerase [Microbacterium sp. ASV81]|uniref:peptidylprolyl isomerase n=1 Tax=Microbacterium capsulatum TaxID=3041921 RepID=A0ABU0XF71_9MICO|nr:FKBP-type peptidyl-prolyl cis-trans isomerase [Microbacterium sp. ASV81]MDQ4212850.1 FKBP-type peptidyl-prolyl cis-trans isomerase [Microbacterium sp. ASV81]
MRKTAAALITLGLAALALTGCSGAPSFDGKGCPSSSSRLTGSVTVTGAVGKAPTVTVDTPMHVQSTTVDVLTAGKGTRITAQHQPLVADVALYSGRTGKQLVATEFNGDTSRVGDVASWASQAKGIGTALQCATAGSRIIAGIPFGDLSSQLASGLNLTSGDSVVAVVDVLKVYLPHAEGSLEYNDALGLPTVVRAPDGRPGIIVPDAKKPTTLVAQTLIRGNGPKVKDTDTVRVQYTGVDWDTRKVFDSSWDKQSASFALNQVIPGFAKGLTGKTVGSQVMLVVPPKDGYGAQGGGSVGPNATLVFVVDILGIDAPAASGQ